MEHAALMHERGDFVAVVVRNVAKGETIKVVTLDGEDAGAISANHDIPLGHKIATKAIERGGDVIKYGRSIGSASASISIGDHVHTQNVTSKRWK